MAAFAAILGIVDLVERTTPEVRSLIRKIRGRNSRGRRMIVPLLVKFMMLREEEQITVARIGEIANDAVKGDPQLRRAVTASFLAAKEAAQAASSEEPTLPDIFGD